MADLAGGIKEIVDLIKGACESEVAITLIEPRNLPRGGYLGARVYDTIRQAVNRRLQRILRQQDFIHFNARPFQRDLRRDGVHWNRRGVLFVGQKFRNYIQRKRESWSIYQALAVGGEENNHL